MKMYLRAAHLFPLSAAIQQQPTHTSTVIFCILTFKCIFYFVTFKVRTRYTLLFI